MIKKILVPTDFSEPSSKGVDYAAELARQFHARLVVVAVIEPVRYMVPIDIYAGMPALVEMFAEQQRLAKAQLAGLVKRLNRPGLALETILTTGTPYKRIVEIAKAKKVDLVVMATHGRGGVSHLLLGSVAEKVVRLASCPVLTLRAYGAEGRKAKRSPRRRTVRTN